MDELIKEPNIDRNRITGVSHKSAAWNVKMMATTALLCAFSITPYIYLNQGADNLKKSTTWVFPVLCATSSQPHSFNYSFFPTNTLSNETNYLIQMMSRWPLSLVTRRNIKWIIMDACTWLLPCLFLIGLVASVVEYVLALFRI